jgi:hypothetical protein
VDLLDRASIMDTDDRGRWMVPQARVKESTSNEVVAEGGFEPPTKGL